MKQSQMLLAVVVLAVMVFVVTFAMNYLGGGAQQAPTPTTLTGPRRELTFATKVFPPDGFSSLEREHRSKGHADFWFLNPHEAKLKVGLLGQSCKCSEVRLFYLPEDGAARVLSDAAAVLGVSAVGAIPTLTLQALATPQLQKGATEYEILKDKEAVTVPARAVGWVRLAFHGERPGAIGLTAVVWTENKDTGPRISLDARVMFLEALRVRPGVQVGTLKESEIGNGVTRYIYCWSPTRGRLELDAKPAYQRKGGAKADPFLIGKPEPLDQVEVSQLQREVMAAAQNDIMEGPPTTVILCAYRIPVTLRAISEDGQTSVDLGPFRRRVMVTSPDVDGEPKSVMVNGRVLGLIELGSEEDGGDINFRVFASKQGKSERMALSSEVPGLKLEIDRERTSPFLGATLQPQGSGSEGRQNWKLTIQVLPGKAFGSFPRRDDPAYEDCAVYLKATAPGRPPQPIRIAAQGTASAE